MPNGRSRYFARTLGGVGFFESTPERIELRGRERWDVVVGIELPWAAADATNPKAITRDTMVEKHVVTLNTGDDYTQCPAPMLPRRAWKPRLSGKCDKSRERWRR